MRPASEGAMNSNSTPKLRARAICRGATTCWITGAKNALRGVISAKNRTDVWSSMGNEAEAGQRAEIFAPYRVDQALMARSDNAWFLHCLPARRGEEVGAEVIDGPRSAVWRQAENRMHSARGAMAWLLGGGQ